MPSSELLHPPPSPSFLHSLLLFLLKLFERLIFISSHFIYCLIPLTWISSSIIPGHISHQIKNQFRTPKCNAILSIHLSWLLSSIWLLWSIFPLNKVSLVLTSEILLLFFTLFFDHSFSVSSVGPSSYQILLNIYILQTYSYGWS